MDLIENNVNIKTGIGNETCNSISPTVQNRKPICPESPPESYAINVVTNSKLSYADEGENEAFGSNDMNHTSITNRTTNCVTESYTMGSVTNSGLDSPNEADDEDSNHSGRFLDSNDHSNQMEECSCIEESVTNSQVSENNEAVLNSPSEEAYEISEPANLNDTSVVNEQSSCATENAVSDEVTNTDEPEFTRDMSSTLSGGQNETSVPVNMNDTTDFVTDNIPESSAVYEDNNTEVNTHEKTQTNSSELTKDSTNSSLSSVPTEAKTSSTEDIVTIDLSIDDVLDEVTNISIQTDEEGENCDSEVRSPTASVSDIGSSPSVYLSPVSDNEDQDQTGHNLDSSSPSKRPKWKPIISGSSQVADKAEEKLSRTAGFQSHMVLIPEDTIKREEFVDESDELSFHEKGPKKLFFPQYPDLQIEDQFTINPCSIKLEKIDWPDFSVHSTIIASPKRSPVNRKRKSSSSPSSLLIKKMKPISTPRKTTFGRRLVVQRRPQTESPNKVSQSKKKDLGASPISTPMKARQRRHISPINRIKAKRDNPFIDKSEKKDSPIIANVRSKRDNPSTDISPIDRKSRRLSGRLPENDVAVSVRETPVASKEVVATRSTPGPRSLKLKTQPIAEKRNVRRAGPASSKASQSQPGPASSKVSQGRPGPASSKTLQDMMDESSVIIRLPKCDFIGVEELADEKSASRKRKSVTFADNLEQWSANNSSIVEAANEPPAKNGKKSKRISRKGKASQPKRVNKVEQAKDDELSPSFLETETEEEKVIIDYKRGIANYLAEVERYRKTIRVMYECLCCDQKYHLLEQAKEHVRGHFPGTLTS